MSRPTYYSLMIPLPRPRLLAAAMLTACALLGLTSATWAAKPRPAPFKQRWLTPYLTQGHGAEARRALLAGKSAKAIKALGRHLQRRRPDDALQARFLLALTLERQGRFARAEALFSGLIKRYPLLADYHRYHGARCLYRLKRFTQAEALAREVSTGAVLKQEAELLRADALRALGRHAEVAKIWKDYLKRKAGQQLGQAHFRAAEALEALARAAPAKRRAELQAEALEHYKQITINAPLWRQLPKAQRRLAALARQVAGGAKKAKLSPWQQLERARRFWTKMRHKQAEAALAALLKEKDLDDKLRCRASFQRARAVFRMRKRARSVPLYEVAIKACRKVKYGDLVVKGLYNRARGLMRRRQFKAAIEQFALIEKEFPNHTYADDARLWAAEAYQALKDKPKVISTLTALPTRYPGGDQAAEALWRLARLAILDRRYAAADKHLDAMLKLGRARIYYAEGQALYWKARTSALRGKHRAARGLYERCIRDYPLSYYALMAFNRLRERHGPRFRKLYRELIASAGARAGSWRFSPRPLFRKPGFLRGVELCRLGLGSEASRELAGVGLKVHRDTPRKDLWLTAVLFDRAGLWYRSHYVPRRLDSAFKRSYPLGADYRRWTVAYPRAFGPLVQAGARGAEIPEALVLAIMREESGFSPTVESWANAVGLMQLLLRTAQRAGNEHKLEVTRRRLKDPAINIKVGTTYLGFLFRSFGKVPALAISGYNAGEGATLKWLRRFGKIPLDQFIDRIPYDQTRRYTKRVLSSFFTYAVLYEKGLQRIPRLGQKLPPARLAAFSIKKKRAKKKSAKKKATAKKTLKQRKALKQKALMKKAPKKKAPKKK
jgi:peptidoglycan lytic transglycosylase